MDAIHKPHELPFVSEEMSIDDFACEMCEALNQIVYNAHLSEQEQLAESIGCSADLIPELQEVCKPEHLIHEDDEGKYVDPLQSSPREDTTLLSLKLYKKELERRNKSSVSKQMATNLMKYRRYNFKMLESLKPNDNAGLVNYCPSDVILTIVFMKPYNRPLEYFEARLGRLIALDCAFYVRGCQKLTDLRDRISCLSDYSIARDFSENPDAPQDVLAKDVYKSGFFYINGTFYNDMRDPTAEDLSDVVIEWAKSGNRPCHLGPFFKGNMDETRFTDLKLRLGVPYLYQHQGSCQHLMVVTDLRLETPEDSHNVEDYPIQITNKLRKRVACCACKVYTAKWVTYESVRVPFEPAFFCDTCFREFNYDQSGNKIGEFKAYPYVDKHALN